MILSHVDKDEKREYSANLLELTTSGINLYQSYVYLLK